MNKPKKIEDLGTKPTKFRHKKRIHHKKYKIRPEIKFYLVILFVCLTFVIFSFTVLFKIKDISVKGCDIYKDEDIIDISGAKIDSNLLLFNKSNASQDIYYKFPYIEEVKIVKKLPSSLEINIKIGTPSLIIEHNGEYFYVSEKGRILEKSENKLDNVLIIRGAELNDYSEGAQIEYKDQQVKRVLEEIYKNIQNEDLKKIKTVDISDLNKITLNYDNRITLLMGNLDKFDYKILNAKEIIEKKISKNETGTLNLSELNEGNKSYFTSEGRVN